MDAVDIPQGKEAKATMKVLSKTKAAGVSSSKTPLRVSGAERTAKPKTDSTLASDNVGQALARPRAGVVGGTETGQARIDGKRKGVDNDKAGNTKLRRKKGECRQGSRSTEGHSTGQAEKGAKVANRADASVKRWGELVTVAKRAVAANEAIESLQRKEKVRVRARAEIAAQETNDTKAKARTQTKTGNVGTGTRVKATEAETSRKHGETTRKVRIAKRPKGNGSIACPVDAHVIVYADAPVPEGDRSRLGPCSPEAPPPSGRSLGGAGDRKVPPPQEPVDRDARMGGATDRVAAAHAQDGARSSSTARASLGSAHGPANAYSSAEGGASSSLRGPSLPGCAGAGGVNHVPSNADHHVQDPSRSTGFSSGGSRKESSDSRPAMGGARSSSSAQGAGTAAPGPNRPRGRARSKASAASCAQGSANASSTAQHADPSLVPSLKRQARFSSRTREGDSSASMPSHVLSVSNPGQAGPSASTAHVVPPPNRHVRFSDEAGGAVTGSSGDAEFFGEPMDTGDRSTGGTAYEGDSGDDPTVIGVFPATDEAARRGFGWGGNLIDCVEDPTVVYEISSDGDEGDTQSLASTVDGAYGEAWHDYYDEGGDAMYEQTPMHHDTVESVVIPDEVAMAVPLEPVYNVRGELLQAGRQPELPTLIHMADVGHMADGQGRALQGEEACVIVQHPPRAPTLREALANPALLEQELAGLDLETCQTVLNAVRKQSGEIPRVVEPATMPRGGAGQGLAGVGMVGSSHPVTPPTSNELSAPGAGTAGRSDGREGTGPPAPPSFPRFAPPGVELASGASGTPVQRWEVHGSTVERSVPNPPGVQRAMTGARTSDSEPVPLTGVPIARPIIRHVVREDEGRGLGRARVEQPPTPSTSWDTSVDQPPCYPASVLVQPGDYALEGHPRMGGARAHVRAHQHVATSCGTKNMLPKIRDLKFTGEARDYMQFRSDFYHRIFVLVHDKATAMLHLENCLPPASDALHEISPYARMPDGLGFDLAWQALDRKYGTAVALEESWTQVLKGPFKDVVECLRVFRQAVVTFESPKTPNGATIASNILSAIRISEMARATFPADLKHKYLQYEAARRLEAGAGPTLRGLVDILEKFVNVKGRSDKMVGPSKRSSDSEVSAAVRETQPPATQPKPQSVKRKQKRKGRSFAVQAHPEGRPGASDHESRCSLCSGGCYRLRDCPKFKAMSVDQRDAYCANNRYCFSCLNLGHRLGECRTSRPCGIGGCSRFHHQMLHPSGKGAGHWGKRPATSFAGNRPKKAKHSKGGVSLYGKPSQARNWSQ